jgi:hypothetical protein
MQFTPGYRTLVRGYTPTAVSDYIWNSCVPRMGQQDEWFDPDCAPPISAEQAQEILDTYVAAPGLLPALRIWITNQMTATGWLTGVRRDSATLVQLLGGEMGHRRHGIAAARNVTGPVTARLAGIATSPDRSRRTLPAAHTTAHAHRAVPPDAR